MDRNARIAELREERGAAYEAMDAILARSNPGMTQADSEIYDRHERRFDEADAEIARIEGRQYSAPDEVAGKRNRLEARDRSGSLLDDTRSNDVTWYQRPAASRTTDETGVLLRQGASFRTWVRDNDLVPEDENDVSVGKMIRGISTGQWNGAKDERLLVGGSDAAGGVMVPTITAAGVLTELAALSQVIASGARIAPMAGREVVVPKIISVPDASQGWRAEAGNVHEADPAFGSLTLTAKSCALRCTISMELLEDATDPAAIDEALIRALAAEIDRVSLYGSGASNQPQGLVGTSGVESAAVTGTIASYAQVLEAVFAVRQRNAYGPVSWCCSPRGPITSWQAATDTTGQFIQPPAVLTNGEATIRPTNRVPDNAGSTTDESSLVAGDFSRLYLGFRPELRIELLKGADLTKLSQIVVCHLRMDVGVAETDAFSVRTGIKADAA